MEKSVKREKKGLIDFLGKRGVILWILLFATVGIFLIWFGGTDGGADKGSQTDTSSRLEQYSTTLESKISDLCSKVRGVSNVSVSVYLDSGFETLYAYDEESKSTSSGINSEKKYVTVGSGNDESMVSIVEKMPNICGIAIVCNGGGDPSVARELIELISAAYGVSSNKIYVTEGKK